MRKIRQKRRFQRIDTSKGVTCKNFEVISDMPANGEMINAMAEESIKMSAMETLLRGRVKAKRILPSITTSTNG